MLYIDTTDRGTDQVARKRRTAASVDSVNQIIYIASDCYLHIFHAAVRSGLQLLDDLLSECFGQHTMAKFGKYFGSLAKLVNIWRERAADIMRAWSDQHETEEASKSGPRSKSNMTNAEIHELGRRYPLSVSSGRWGSVESAEEFLLERGRALTEPVILQVLSKQMKADPDYDQGQADAGTHAHVVRLFSYAVIPEEIP